MRKISFLALGTIVFLIPFFGFSAFAKKKAATADFSARLSKDQQIEQALNRLTLGPRPGDAEHVKSIGLKKWIDQQLHPDRIAENPELEAKLKWLDSLGLSQAQLAAKYPPRQVILQMLRGRLPLPADPGERMMIQRLALRYNRQLNGQSAIEKPPQLSTLLSPDQVRIIQRGTPEQKVDLVRSLAPDQQDTVIGSMPQGLRFQMIRSAPPDLRRKLEMANGPEQVITEDLMEGKLLRAVLSHRQLEEVLTDFWFNHFNVFLDKGADRYLTTSYERDVIRPHVLGKFHDLLLATAESPAMLYYLDNWESAGPNTGRGRARRGLNENYGRELMELHTLGVDGGYTQKDVTEVARCFTGWTIRNLQSGQGQFYFNPAMHDRGEKVVLGVTIPAGGGQEDGLKVLDILAHHPSTARFISRSLAVRFVSDNPPQSLVDRMAKTFRRKDGDLREVMKTMLNSREFWSRGAYRSKMKSPLEMVASSVRAVGGDIDYGFALVQQVTQLGEPLYRKQEPTGYSNQSQDWVNSASLLARMNFGVALAENRIPGVKVSDPNMQEGLKIGSPEFQRR
jgi:uncharacterized protein (DUF1800 family)